MIPKLLLQLLKLTCSIMQALGYLLLVLLVHGMAVENRNTNNSYLVKAREIREVVSCHKVASSYAVYEPSRVEPGRGWPTSKPPPQPNPPTHMDVPAAPCIRVLQAPPPPSY